MYSAMYGGGDRSRGLRQCQGQPGRDQSRGGSQLNNIDRAMALHNSASPTLNSAKQLDTSQFGSRRETGVQTAEPQRQRPERGT